MLPVSYYQFISFMRKVVLQFRFSLKLEMEVRKPKEILKFYLIHLKMAYSIICIEVLLDDFIINRYIIEDF